MQSGNKEQKQQLAAAFAELRDKNLRDMKFEEPFFDRSALVGIAKDYEELCSDLSLLRNILCQVEPSMGGDPLNEMIGSPRSVVYHVTRYLKSLQNAKTALREIRDLYDDSKSVGELATLLYDAQCIAIRALNAHEDDDA